MTDPADQDAKPLGRNADSLGWLVGSTVLPKKARLIEGRGLVSVVGGSCY